MPKTTKRTCTPEFKTAVAPGVLRGGKTLTQVASERGAAPSLACAWRDQPEQSAGDVFSKARQDRDRKRSEEAAQAKYDEALRTIIGRFVERHDDERVHQGLGYETPAVCLVKPEFRKCARITFGSGHETLSGFVTPSARLPRSVRWRRRAAPRLPRHAAHPR